MITEDGDHPLLCGDAMRSAWRVRPVSPALPRGQGPVRSPRLTGSCLPSMPAFKSPVFSGGGEMPTSHRLGGWKQARSAAGPVLVWPGSGVKDPCTNTFICNTHTLTDLPNPEDKAEAT